MLTVFLNLFYVKFILTLYIILWWIIAMISHIHMINTYNSIWSSVSTLCTNVQLFTDQILFAQVQHITYILKILACQGQVLSGSGNTVLQLPRWITVFAFSIQLLFQNVCKYTDFLQQRLPLDILTFRTASPFSLK